MSAESTVAWRPDVEGIAEVFRAHFEEHAYPMHTHDVWTLLTVDRGRIGYELGGERCDSSTRSVTLLPPHVAHDGHSLTAGGFDKRVIYLESRMLTGVGRAVGRPTLLDGPLRGRVDRLNSALTAPGEEFEASSRLALILERLQWHLDGNPQPPGVQRNRSVAHAFRDLLDARIREGMTLAEAGRTLHVDPTHLVREFSREFGLLRTGTSSAGGSSWRAGCYWPEERPPRSRWRRASTTSRTSTVTSSRWSEPPPVGTREAAESQVGGDRIPVLGLSIGTARRVARSMLASNAGSPIVDGVRREREPARARPMRMRKLVRGSL